jgi:predicted RNase H-like HicB family nuclease
MQKLTIEQRDYLLTQIAPHFEHMSESALFENIKRAINRCTIEEVTITLEFKVYAYDEIVVACKELPEVVSAGSDLQEAVTNGADAICEAIAGRMHRNEQMPWDEQ